MGNQLSYVIDPESFSQSKAALLTPEEEREARRVRLGLVILVFLALQPLLLLGLDALPFVQLSNGNVNVNGTPWFGIPWLVVAALGLSIAFDYLLRRTRTKEILKRKRHQAQKQRTDRARLTATHLIQIVQSIPGETTSIAAHLDNANAWLDLASEEYRNRAFAPFWDAVENAAVELANIRSRIVQLGRKSDEYYSTLSHVQHTFPLLPLDPGAIPDISGTAARLSQLTRRGQTDFQFATIWEHRKTRECIVAGFESFGEVVMDAGKVVASSIEDLRISLASDASRIVHEQIATRDAIAGNTDVLKSIRTNQQLEMLARGRR